MGVTGFTPSVCRAAVAVWVGALGVWLYGPPDTLTSLAVAGIVMTAGNSYAVCDIGFELSFAAVVGTVAGGVCIRRARDAWYRQFWKNAKNPVKRPWYFKLPERLWGLAESICISFCASVATFPVLVLRGLSVSLYGGTWNQWDESYAITSEQLLPGDFQVPHVSAMAYAVHDRRTFSAAQQHV